jgi:glyoxylate/hydroxypyruvate reductase
LTDELGTVTVLIASPLEPELVARIAAVDARVSVIRRPELVGSARFRGDHTPPITRNADQTAEWAALLANTEVLFDIERPVVPDLVGRAPRLRWVQTTSSGVGEWIRRQELDQTSIVVTNAAGIHAAALAEFALFAMLYFARDMPRLLAEQRAHHWQRCAVQSLRSKTVGIVGLGRVGREVARVARALGMRVIGSRRSAATSGERVDNVDRVLPPDQLRELLTASDYVVLSVPHSADTSGMLGTAELQVMRPTAVLINIARGAIMDEAALVDALRAGRLAGAALDVFQREPLPEDSPLWDMPNVLVTPHSMSTATDENERLVELFCANLRRYLDGDDLLNVVNKVRGY